MTTARDILEIMVDDHFVSVCDAAGDTVIASGSETCPERAREVLEDRGLLDAPVRCLEIDAFGNDTMMLWLGRE